MNQTNRAIDSEANNLFWFIGPQSLEEIKGVEVLGSTSIDLNNEVCQSSGAVVHSNTSLIVCLGNVGIRKRLAGSHSYVIEKLDKHGI